MFFRFSFNLDPVSVDYRINQIPTFLSFYLRLPQHGYSKKEEKIEEIFSPAAKQLLQALQPETVDLSGSKVNIFGSPTKKVSSPTVDPPKGTPKMSALFNSSSNILIIYYGGVDFLDNKEEFDSTFGKDLVLLHTNPVSYDSSSAAKYLLDLATNVVLMSTYILVGSFMLVMQR